MACSTVASFVGYLEVMTVIPSNWAPETLVGSGVWPAVVPIQKEQLKLQCKVSSMKNRAPLEGNPMVGPEHPLAGIFWLLGYSKDNFLGLLEIHGFGSGAISVCALVGMSWLTNVLCALVVPKQLECTLVWGVKVRCTVLGKTKLPY